MRRARTHRTSPGGTDRRRRHRFPTLVPEPRLIPAPSKDEPLADRTIAVGDIDALLWEQAADLVHSVSER